MCKGFVRSDYLHLIFFSSIDEDACEYDTNCSSFPAFDSLLIFQNKQPWNIIVFPPSFLHVVRCRDETLNTQWCEQLGGSSLRYWNYFSSYSFVFSWLQCRCWLGCQAVNYRGTELSSGKNNNKNSVLSQPPPLPSQLDHGWWRRKSSKACFPFSVSPRFSLNLLQFF